MQALVDSAIRVYEKPFRLRQCVHALRLLRFYPLTFNIPILVFELFAPVTVWAFTESLFF